MSPTIWSLRDRRPSIAITLARGKGRRVRHLLADTGAGSDQSSFELLLSEKDCRESAIKVIGQTNLTGAYAGLFDVFAVVIRIPKLKFDDTIAAVGVPYLPYRFDGIACFKFLNRFHYGNFGDTESLDLSDRSFPDESDVVSSLKTK